MPEPRLAILSSLLLLLLPGLSLTAQDSLAYYLEAGAMASKHNFSVTLADDQGRESEIPVSVIKGKTAGRVFTVIAGVHGYEYPPIIAAQELIQDLDPAQLEGTVIILPLLNPGAFYGRSPFLNPQDQLNLNRIFPGDPSGTITERIADYVTQSVIAHSDVVLDIHGGDANEDLLPFVCYYNNEKRPQETLLAKQLSENSGFEYVVSYGYTLNDEDPAKYLFKQAVQDGKVGLSIECGKLGNVQPEAVTKIKVGVYRMLEQAGMMPPSEKQAVELIRLTDQSY
ncbi:MAG: M14 family metallopeptidase, partial [Bacteroidota bacterium]